MHGVLLCCWRCSLAAQFKLLQILHFQQLNRGPAYQCKADDIDVSLYEMLAPILLSRMQKLHHLSGLGNDGRQTRIAPSKSATRKCDMN